MFEKCEGFFKEVNFTGGLIIEFNCTNLNFKIIDVYGFVVQRHILKEWNQVTSSIAKFVLEKHWICVILSFKDALWHY